MPSPHAALIVDVDPKGLEALIYGFQGADWRMTACPSPETASLLVKASAAEIVVIASRSEHERTLALVHQLRANPACRTLPVLVLGPEELREPLKEDGEVELLPLPAFVRDVLTASELLVAMATSAAQRPGQDPCYESTISSVKTLSLVRTMNALSRSGHLRLDHHGRLGDLMFHEGELTAASAGPLQGMAAVQHLMIWNDGKLELHFHHVPRRGQLHLSAADFVQEMDRFQRDFAHAMKEIGPAGAVYLANQERLRQSSGAVPPEVTPVVRLCNGSRPLSDVIDESPFRVLDTVRILGRLAELGILTRGDGKPVMAGAGEDFLENARIMGGSPPPAWPMPAPIGGFPMSTPILKAAPAEAVKQAAKAKDPEPATPQAPAAGAEGRPRRQTQEIGISAAPAPAAPSSGSLPSAPAPAVKTAPMRFAPLGPEPGPVTPPPVAPAPARPARPAPASQASATIRAQVASAPPLSRTPAPVTPTPKLRPGAAVTPKPAVTTPAPSPTATIMQASGAFAAKGAADNTPVVARVEPPSAARPATANAAAAVTRAAGVIDSHKHVRKTKSAMPTAGERRSVVIEAIAAESGVTPAPAPQAAAPSTPATHPRTPAPVTPPAAPSTATTISGMPAPPEPATGGAAPVAGVMHVAPSRRTATQVIPTGRVSIQLDTSLTTPAPAQTPQPPVSIITKPEPPGSRVTGEMHVPSSGRSTRSMDKAAPKGSSFHIDPSLSEAAAKPASRTDSQPVDPKRTDSRPVPLRRSDSRPTPGAKRHQSGSFSTVETDFFEREADLYKQEKTESFADLDEGQPKGKPGAKGKGGKPGRPYRR